VISPDTTLRRSLERRIADSGGVLVLKTLDRYPDIEEAAGAVRAHAAHAVFIDVASNPNMIAMASQLQRSVPGLSAVALHYEGGFGGGFQRLLMDLLHSGIRELLCDPFEAEAYLEAIHRISHNVSEVARLPEKGEIYAFLPAKGGAGASTIAVNTALALGRLEEGKTLLADCDLNCGVVRFQLKMDHPFSIQDALEKGPRLDDSVWPDLAPHAHHVPGDTLDVLASGGIVPRYPYPATHALSLLEFARSRYRRVLLDLSDHLEQFAVDMLSQCRRIYLVVHPELCTVHLAREKIRFLKSVDLDERVEVLVPLRDELIRERVRHEILGAYLADNRKARVLQKDATYIPIWRSGRHASWPQRLRLLRRRSNLKQRRSNLKGSRTKRSRSTGGFWSKIRNGTGFITGWEGYF